MARKKVNIKFISNAAKRKATFNKRKNDLVKKISEITTLCAIPACAVIFSPDETEPVVWPSDSGVKNMISKLREMPEIEQGKKMLMAKITMMEIQLKRIQEKKRKKEMTLFMWRCLKEGKLIEPENELTAEDYDVLRSLVDQNLRDIDTRLETLRANKMALVNDDEADEGSNVVNANEDETTMPALGDASPQP